MPIIKNKNNDNASVYFTETIKNEILKIQKEVSKAAEDNYIYLTNQGMKYEMDADYRITYNKDNILSVVLRAYYYAGGAHGMTVQWGHNIDFNSGKELKLQDIFKGNLDYKSVIKKEIEGQMEKDKDKYFPDAKINIDDKTTFYIEGEDLVVYYELYDIAPYVSGIPEFKIPLSKFNGKLKI